MDDLKKPTSQSAFNPKASLPSSSRYGAGAPDGKPTAQMEAAPAWAIKMQEGINANHTLVVNEIHAIRTDVEALKAWRQTGKHPPAVLPEGPKTTTSGEVRRISANDLKQDGAIANIMVDVAKLQATVGVTDSRKMIILEDVYKRGTSFIDSPTGRLLKGIIAFAIAAYATARGIHIGN